MSLMRIDEIFNFEKGVLQSSKCVPGDFDFITASADWKTHHEFTHDCEALIFAAAASGSLGRTHYVNGKFISSDLCFIITPKDQDKLPVDLKFYHILFNELKDEIVRNTKAGTSKEAIGLGSFGKYRLPYFGVKTQIEIKKLFVKSEEINAEISSELTHQLTLVKKLRQQLLQDAVQGKLVPQNRKDEPASELLRKIKAEKAELIAEKKLKKDKELTPIKPEEIPFEIPENWVWCRLGEMCFHITDGEHVTPQKQKEGRLLLSAKNIRDGFIVYDNVDYISEEDFQKSIKRCRPEKSDVLIVSVGGTIGRSTVMKDDVEFAIVRSVALIKPFIKLMADFIKFILDSPILQKEINGRSWGTAQPCLYINQIKELTIPLPPLTEQTRIVQKLDELMQHCNELEASIRESESHNEKLLQQVLREALRRGAVNDSRA
jgi:type I restriction enzyme S subunit